MCSKTAVLSSAMLLAGLSALYGQDRPIPQSSIKIKLPERSPVLLLSANMGESRATARGGALVLDLHMALSLQNLSPNKIRGVTLLVRAQEVTPGGKASVAVPSLDVSPGQAFPVRIDLQLLRPLQPGGGPLVEVGLDGVLFHDFSFFGPDSLHSRRSMTAWETEAQRDRQYFKSVLTAYGPQVLQQEMVASLARQFERPRLDVRLARGGRATAASGPEHLAQFAFLELPDSPVKPLGGWAEIAGSEARAPRIEVLNRSSKPVSYVEIGWIVKDRQGREYMAASVPASESEMFLPPGKTGRVLQDTALRFSRNAGEPVAIQGMTAFVSQVQYSDGNIWVPARSSLNNPTLMRVLAPSPEEQRLTDLYRKKGIGALIEELKKF
jgi:hypothetical protein